jgi:hypothetical protein
VFNDELRREVSGQTECKGGNLIGLPQHLPDF